uniref:F-box domain-containing protein n=2 Tax=Panagrolaimus sp. JU765 TaxID=591449 RepID=A0AC34RS02_9BILA
MEYFNFLGLPEVVQDLVVHEIVHNSIPNDRIQLALTCKYINQSVKRAKPKKIVEYLKISFYDDICFEIGTKIFRTKIFRSLPTPESFTNICQILQQIQAENLIMITNSLNVEDTQNSGLFHHLFEASKFVTALRILHDGLFPEFTAFYNKLEHLEFMIFRGSIEMFNSLSHYPSKMDILADYDSSLLENITKKTVNNSLSSLYFCKCIPVEDLQQFLQATKFKNGCEIHFEVQNSEFEEIHIFMTFIDDEHGFEIETFPRGSSLIVADQNCDVKEERILTLSTAELSFHSESSQDSESRGIPFNVTTKTQPILPVFSDFFYGEDFFQDYVLENIKENDWIKINTDAHVHYSNKMLESNFPRNEFATAQERLTSINATLGCRISIIKAEELIDTIQKLKEGEDSDDSYSSDS